MDVISRGKRNVVQVRRHRPSIKNRRGTFGRGLLLAIWFSIKRVVNRSDSKCVLDLDTDMLAQ